MISNKDNGRNSLEILSRNMEEDLPENIPMIRAQIEHSFLNSPRETPIIPSRERVELLLDEGHFGLVEHLISRRWNEKLVEGGIIELLISKLENAEDWKKENWSRRLLEIDPSNILAAETMMEISIRDGNEEEANRMAETIASLEEGNYQALNYIISRKKRRGEWEDIISLCEKLLEFHSDDFFALKSLAEAQTAMADNTSLKTWSTVLEIGELSDKEMIRVARNYYNSSDFQKVISILREIEGENGKEENVMELLARSYYSLNEWGNCYKICSRLVSIFPENMVGLRLRMRSMKRMEDADGTMMSAKAILESQQNDTEALKNLIQSAASISDWEAVEEISNIAIEDEKLEIDALRWRARSVSRQGKANSIDAWEELLKRLVEDVEAFLEIGKIHYNSHQNELAEEKFQNALTLNPENLRAKRALASCKIRRGLLSEAIPLLHSICEQDEGSVSAWESLIETYLRMEKRAEANRAWGSLIGKTWESSDQYFIAIEVALRFHWDSRLRWLMNTRARRLDESDLQYPRLAEVYLKVGDIATSWGYLQRGGDSELCSEIGDRIEEVLQITRTKENELKKFYENGEPLWIQGLVVREIVRRCEKFYSPRKGRKKVALISSSLNRGGAERQLAYTFRGLNRKKYDCELVVQRFDNRGEGETFLDLINEFQNEAFEVSQTEIAEGWSNGTYNKIENDLLELLPATVNDAIKRLVSHFNNEVPDLVHCWQDQTIVSSSIASLICGVPRVIGSARSMRPDEKSELHIRKRPYLSQSMEHLLSGNRIFLTTNSEAGKRSYSEWLQIDSDEIGVIHNGIDFELMEESIDSKKFKKEVAKIGIKKGHKIVGGVFRLEAGKRIELWLDVFAESLKSEGALRGVIVGSGRMGETVERWIEEKGLKNRVSLVGSKEDVASWLNLMDVFLLTSVTEGLPNVIIEAQGFGVPAVSTDVGGVGEVINHDWSGLIVDSNNPLVIANAVIEGLGKRNRSFGIRAKRRARKFFSVDAMIKNTEKCYEQVLAD